MNPELKLQFQQKLHTLHIHAGLGVDENNISKVHNTIRELYYISKELYEIAHPTTENDTAEATKELEKVKPHKSESK